MNSFLCHGDKEMGETIRERVLAFLEDNSSSSSKQIAENLNLSIKQVFDAVTKLKRLGRIIATNTHPPHNYSLNKEYKGSVKRHVSRIKAEPTPSVEFNKFVIIYIDKNSPGPKMLNSFINEEELMNQFSELQKSPDLVDIAVYKKVEVIQKLELKI